MTGRRADDAANKLPRANAENFFALFFLKSIAASLAFPDHEMQDAHNPVIIDS
jgi:hypothetical protein